MNSMTGYGRGENMANGRWFIVEIKSVNHRYNDISVKLPKILSSMEDKIKKSISTKVSRGKIDVYVSFETMSKEDYTIKINEQFADLYVEQLTHLKERYGLKDEITLSTLVGISDILTVERTAIDEDAMWAVINPALDEAVNRFLNMRQLEGEALEADLLQKTERIEALVEKVLLLSPQVVENHREKLRKRLNEVLLDTGIDENRLMMEIALFADKSCIDEELTRLSGHLTQLRSIFTEGDSVGRKLDFLAQEMNREVNTIGSKSNDLAITNLVVELKSELEKIREQVQNIE